jgi:hypothetical protein
VLILRPNSHAVRALLHLVGNRVPQGFLLIDGGAALGNGILVNFIVLDE